MVMVQPFYWTISGLLIFFVLTMVILPAIVMWIDEYLYVDEIEKEQQEEERKPGEPGSLKHA